MNFMKENVIKITPAGKWVGEYLLPPENKPISLKDLLLLASAGGTHVWMSKK